MKRVIGFALFWVAAGMAVALILSDVMITLLCILICLLMGYNLFMG